MDHSTREYDPGQGPGEARGGGSGGAGRARRRGGPGADPFAQTADLHGGHGGGQPGPHGAGAGAWTGAGGRGSNGGAWNGQGADPFARTLTSDYPVPPQRRGFDGPDGPYAPEELRPPRRISRRVLFASGGLALVAGCAVAQADRQPPKAAGGSAPAGSVGRGGASPSASRRGGPTGAGSPSDLSSSAGGTQSPPPSASSGTGAGGTVASAPEYYVHAGAKAIALTIDDGPTAQYTPQVLAILQQHGVKATFNMIGRQVGANRSLVQEVAAAGHTVANHTWDHADQSKLTLAKVLSEIHRTGDALQEAGITPTLFRAPYGAWSHTVFQACAQADLRPVDWSVDPRDWSRPGTSVIVDRIMDTTHTGSIILEHDGGGDRSQTVAALKIVIPRLIDDGYHFVGV